MSTDTAPVCPEDAPPEIAAEFNRLAALMGNRAETIDSLALHMLAQSLATWRKATASVNELGLLVSSGGVTIQNPNIAIAAKAQSQIAQLLRELKLTPATRGKKRREEETPLPPMGFDED